MTSYKNNLTQDEFDDFQDYIYMNLGGCVVDIELDVEHYQHAFKEAKRMYLQKGNVTNHHRFLGIVFQAGVREYTIDESINTPLQLIRYRSSFFNKEDPFHHAIVSDLFRNVGVGQSNLFNYNLSLQLLENINKMMAHDITFRFNRNENKIILDQPPKNDGEKALLEAYIDPPDSELVEHAWVREWGLSVAEITLGRAYSKFSEVKTPTGTTKLNGDDLIKSGQERQEKLLEQINNFEDQFDNPKGAGIFVG